MMDSTHKNVVILGGGLAGLTAAFRLHKEKLDFILLEKSNQVGGTAKTIKKDGYTYDLTGHALHLSDEKVKKLIFNDLNLSVEFEKVQRNSVIFVDGNIIPYPFQYNLAYLPEKSRDRCVLEYLKTHFYHKDCEDKEYCSFEDYCYNTLGKEISEIFMKPYNEKLWATRASDMTTEWMGKFVPRPDSDKIIEGAFIKKEIDSSGYNAYFYYPKSGGIQIISDALLEKVSDKIVLNANISEIDLDKKIIRCGNNMISYNHIITTIPSPELLHITHLDDKVHLNLEWTIVRAFFVTIPTTKSPKYSWIYIPSKKSRIYRIGNFSQFSTNLSHGDNDLLYVETAAHNTAPNSLPQYPDIASELEEILNVDKESIGIIDIIDINPAYAIYNKTWREDTETMKSILEQYNVHNAGRYGNWMYGSMEDAIRTGISVAEKVIKSYHSDKHE